MIEMKELSLRPYHGRLFFVKNKKAYEAAHKKLFKTADVLTFAQAGRFTGGEGKDGMWTYLIYAETPAVAAHEFAHVIFATFERCGIDPTQAREEPFCYLLSQLMLDAGYG
jgi:hypothetical protein